MHTEDRLAEEERTFRFSLAEEVMHEICMIVKTLDHLNGFQIFMHKEKINTGTNSRSSGFAHDYR